MVNNKINDLRFDLPEPLALKDGVTANVLDNLARICEVILENDVIINNEKLRYALSDYSRDKDLSIFSDRELTYILSQYRIYYLQQKKSIDSKVSYLVKDILAVIQQDPKFIELKKRFTEKEISDVLSEISDQNSKDKIISKIELLLIKNDQAARLLNNNKLVVTKDISKAFKDKPDILENQQQTAGGNLKEIAGSMLEQMIK